MFSPRGWRGIMIDIPDYERRRAFSIWLRTGRLPSLRNAEGIELKFNPCMTQKPDVSPSLVPDGIMASGAAVGLLVAEAVRVAVAARPVQEIGRPGHPGQDRKIRRTAPLPKIGRAPPRATKPRLPSHPFTSRPPNAHRRVADLREAAAVAPAERERRERGDHPIQTVVRRIRQVWQLPLRLQIAPPGRTELPHDPQARPANNSARSCTTAIPIKSTRASGRGAFLVR